MPAIYVITKEDSMNPELLARHRAKATNMGRRLVIESAGATPNSGLTIEEILASPAVGIAAGHEEESA